jgi:phosphoglycolate phosphatase
MPSSSDGRRLAAVTSPPDAVTAVLWDIDGTLITSGGAVARTFLDAVEDICGTRPTPAGLDFGGRLDPDIAALLVEAIDGRPSQVPEVLAHFEALVATRRDALSLHVALLPGVRELVTELGDLGVPQTVVTGNLESVGLLKLHAAGLVPPLDPALGGFGASAPDRAGVAQIALDRLVAAGWHGSPETCWVIGDTPRDLACARALGLRCALVATGRHSADSLTHLGADLVLSTFGEPALLRTAWFG